MPFFFLLSPSVIKNAKCGHLSVSPNQHFPAFLRLFFTLGTFLARILRQTPEFQFPPVDNRGTEVRQRSVLHDALYTAIRLRRANVRAVDTLLVNSFNALRSTYSFVLWLNLVVDDVARVYTQKSLAGKLSGVRAADRQYPITTRLLLGVTPRIIS